MKVRRRNPAIDEAVEVLDQHLLNCDGDVKAAFETLTPFEQDFIDKEIYRCVIDARYYLENYHVVMTEAEGLKTLYPFWDSQEMFYYEIVKIQSEGRPVKLIVLKARQLGISTVTEGLIFHKTIFTPGCNTLIVAQDPGQADFLFGMSRLAYDELPWWMRPEERYQAKGRYLILDKKDDLERRLNPGLKSQILVEAANKMTGVARGKTIRCAHFSELASWVDGGILSQSIFPTMNAPDELAVMESTAEGRQGFWYSFWKDSIKGETEWHPLFIEYFRVKKYSKPISDKAKWFLTDEEKALREKIKQRCQFEISDETFNWVRAKKREFISLEGDEWKFYQEYPLGWMEAFQGSGLCAFPKRLLQKINESQTAPPRWYGEITFHLGKAPRDRIHLHGTYVFDNAGRQIPGIVVPPQEHDGGRLRIWEMPEEGETYYIGADVAHGVEGGDYSCAQVLKIGRGQQPDEQVAEWRGWINPTPYAHVIAGLGYLYGEAQIAVEVNDVGLSTNNELFRIIEYENVYRWKHIDKIKNFITDLTGWYTNSKTRDTIISKMREAIMSRTIILRNEDLLDEMMDFSSDGGRFEGQDSNDDRVMAMQICHYCAHESDYGKEAAAQAPSGGRREEIYYLFDDLNRLRGQYTDRESAEKALESSPANWSLKTMPNRRDFHNTDFSPVHDKPGIRQRMHTELGIPAELIMHNELFAVPRGDDPDNDWKDY